MRYLFCTLLFIFGISTTAISQKKFHIRTVAFYNLENLFDTINDPSKKDELSPIMGIKKGKAAVYQKKIHNMAKVIAAIGSKEAKNSPVILGVAEVENSQVLEDLIQSPILKNKQYGIIHYNSPDIRGIDVALLYQKAYFKPTHHETFELRLWDAEGKRIYTRDPLWVAGYLDEELIHIIVNHWPSRRGGEAKSSPKREKAAYLNTLIVEKIRGTDANAKIIIMGDFNDDPGNASLKKVLKTVTHKSKLKKNDLYNPMENLFKNGQNTLVYRDNLNLFDQILFSASFVNNEKDFSSYKMYKTAVFKPLYLTTQEGKYKGYPFRSFSRNGFIGGYSDHYPVYSFLIKAF